jgi:TIR domain
LAWDPVGDVPIVAEAEQPKARIFISYSRKDMAFADRLETALKARGFEPLIDRIEIYAFEDWWKSASRR